jgi:hypothetical protein
LGADRSVARARCAAVAVAALAILVAPCVAIAQQGPVFQLQPGLQVSDFVSVPDETLTNSAFSVRFTTRFPTNLSWLMPVAGAVLLPYGSTQNTIRNTDAPTIFAGNIFTLVTSARTGGWFSIELPLLLAHSPGAGPTGNLRDYGRDLVVVPTVYLHLGARGLSELGSIWSRLNLFAQLEQNLTPNRDPATGDRDFFNPVATFGVSLRIGGAPN